jgi:hypothetical protein
MPAKLFTLVALTFTMGAVPIITQADHHAAETEWQELFNGQDLRNWSVKITGQPLGQDKYQTFRVAEGVLQVRYDNYEGFNNQFGHLFYAQPLSHYELLVEYRFVGEQVSGGPAWAERNSGVMLHAQAPGTMTVGQDFPDSIEAQFLGGLSDGKMRPTGSVCTPGTEIMLDNGRAPQHCTYSSSTTFDGNQWVQMRIEVNGHGDIAHFVFDDVVMRYHSPQLSENAKSADGKPSLKLERGYIALQSESHPIDFRRVAYRPISRK